uniref:putative RNA polymerase II subunit B1 CTD phosphatase rpap2 isoform X2 n=1 Tax=Monopterus albus TaxID=43700 RepID=UPI0009B397FE|nr:putative RNA polymerase II subunit B1 CTD phosphatase RPAP2 isoform X2 [Monopterus albus]
METKEKRRSGGSSKRLKKGGKCTKALTDEEEEKRREDLREKLREKLELEKSSLKVVERLLEDSVAADFLVDCAKFITTDNYKDAVEERFIAKLCGYPLCPNKLGKIPSQQYKISTKTNKVYDITERKCFCSNFCYKASKTFELQISPTPLWLRHHESPPEITLMKKRDGGSSGEEVMLSKRWLHEEYVENPLATLPKDPHGSQLSSAVADLTHSDGSDVEPEQDFVSSVVSQRQGPRVHWGDLPKRTDEDKKGERGKEERRKKQRGEGDEEETEHNQSQDTEKEVNVREDEQRKETDAEKPSQLHVVHTNLALLEEKDLLEELSVEATAQLKVCSLSETLTHSTSMPVGSASTQAEHTTPLTHNTTLPQQPGLNITQAHMSKRGAARLRDLLKNHPPAPKPDSVQLNILECLTRTLKEWCTDETLKFLYGADHSLGSHLAHVREEEGEVEEELDEDDLEDEVTVEDRGGLNDGVQKRPSAAPPDYETLHKETQQLELRVREFYKGTWILSEEVEELNGNKVTVQDQCMKDPVLPLVDSCAQHLIQKRITVDKISSWCVWSQKHCGFVASHHEQRINRPE